MFLMTYRDGDCEISNVNLIRYAMIKLSKCGNLYTKAIYQWQIKNAADKKIWLIVDYEKVLPEGRVTTLGQEGYGMTFNITEGIRNYSSITYFIVRYTEHATEAEGKVQAL